MGIAGDTDNFNGAASFTAPSGGVTKGLIYNITDLYVLARETAAEGASFVGQVSGLVWASKEVAAADDAWAVGDEVFYDPATKKATGDSATTNAVLIGYAIKAAAQTDTVGQFFLEGHPMTST